MKTLWAACLLVAILGACSAERPDWEPKIRAANDALLNRGEVDRVADFFLPTYILHTLDGDLRAPEVIVEFVTALRLAFPDLQVEIEILATEGNRVAWRRTHRGTHQGDFMGVPASGRSIVWQTTVVTRYEDGMIAEEWGTSDLVGRLGGQP